MSESEGPSSTQSAGTGTVTVGDMPAMPTPDISRMGYNPANFAYWVGTGPWVAGYRVSYAVSFYEAGTRTESARSAWWGPKTDPKKLYGGFGLIRIPVDPTGRATARRIW